MGTGRSSERAAAASSLKLAKLTLCLVVLTVLALSTIDQVNGQFFTKSSKSIPRMGRRSLPEYQNAMEAYRHLLADDYNEQQQVDYRNDDNSFNREVAEPSRGRLADMIRSRPRAFDADYTARMSRDGRSGELPN